MRNQESTVLFLGATAGQAGSSTQEQNRILLNSTWYKITLPLRLQASTQTVLTECSGGTLDSSPAIHRGVWRTYQPALVPEGRLNSDEQGRNFSRPSGTRELPCKTSVPRNESGLLSGVPPGLPVCTLVDRFNNALTPTLSRKERGQAHLPHPPL